MFLKKSILVLCIYIYMYLIYPSLLLLFSKNLQWTAFYYRNMYMYIQSLEQLSFSLYKDREL